MGLPSINYVYVYICVKFVWVGGWKIAPYIHELFVCICICIYLIWGCIRACSIHQFHIYMKCLEPAWRSFAHCMYVCIHVYIYLCVWSHWILPLFHPLCLCECVCDFVCVCKFSIFLFLSLWPQEVKRIHSFFDGHRMTSSGNHTAGGWALARGQKEKSREERAPSSSHGEESP